MDASSVSDTQFYGFGHGLCDHSYPSHPAHRDYGRGLAEIFVAEDHLLPALQSAPASFAPEAAAHHYRCTYESGSFALPQGDGWYDGNQRWPAVAVEHNRVPYASAYDPLPHMVPPMNPGMPITEHVTSSPLLPDPLAWPSSPPSGRRQYYPTANALLPAAVPMSAPPKVQHSRESSFSDLSSDEGTSPKPTQARATVSRRSRAVSSSPYAVSSSAHSTTRPSPSPRAPKKSRSRPSIRASSRDLDGPRLKCPHCDYRPRRPQELRRHIKTHAPPMTKDGEAFWICCGVPLAEAAARGVPPDIAKSTPFEYNGMQFVGGCQAVLSRRDALRRHLIRPTCVCYGDQYGWYLWGNQERR
ncbi:hypothetical protein TRAPUB_7848 [Trametes pubescens]|uniref:C2H2-type domain-containing protein n=1 Tax=Trametes pubescens TaxID=154538 RepID=A0A1M2V2H6_TRAPU|nr:hypothetical protein TRAPUB_7848 [Trametes pubescens]